MKGYRGRLITSAPLWAEVDSLISGKKFALPNKKDSINRIPQCFGGCKAEKHLKFSKNQGKITTPSKYRPRVIELTKEGFSRGKIARALHISVGTIRQYQREAKIQGLL